LNGVVSSLSIDNSLSNLNKSESIEGTAVVRQQKIENENRKRAKTFIEHFQMKNGYLNLSEVSRLLHENGYKTRNGSLFSPTTAKRLVNQDYDKNTRG
jgi:hypothetical protein